MHAAIGSNMNNPRLRTPFGEVELRPVASPVGAPEGMQTYVLLPDLEDLLGAPGFGLRNPIMVGRTRGASCLGSLLFH